METDRYADPYSYMRAVPMIQTGQNHAHAAPHRDPYYGAPAPGDGAGTFDARGDAGFDCVVATDTVGGGGGFVVTCVPRSRPPGRHGLPRPHPHDSQRASTVCVVDARRTGFGLDCLFD